MGHRASAWSQKTSHNGKGKNSTHQAEEDDQERHVQFEEETDMGTFVVCALEGCRGEKERCEHERDEQKSRLVLASGWTLEIMMKPCEEIMANLKGSAMQRNGTHERSGSSSSGQRDGCSQTDATRMTGSRESGEVQNIVMHECRPRQRARRVQCTTRVVPCGGVDLCSRQ